MTESISDMRTGLREGKVIVLGEGHVGKTSTVHRIRNKGQLLDYDTKMTPGVEIEDIDIHDVEFQVAEKERLTIHFWDFGGQVIGRSMHQMFMTDNTVYLIVVSNRTSNMREQISGWLDTVKTFAPHSPVLLAINKWDGIEPISVDGKELLRDYSPNLREIISYSVREEENFPDLMEKLGRLVLEVNQERFADLPDSWSKIREQLSTDISCGKHFLDADLFRKICRDNGVDCEEEDNLLEYLISIGACFHYHLYDNDYRILQPQWLTNAIYILLEHGNDEAEDDEKDGILTRKEIRKLLKTSGLGVVPDMVYEDEQEIEQILGVMRKFQLSYPLKDKKEFIPELCQRSRPDAWNSSDYARHFTYEMEYRLLPLSMLHCLMVRCYKRIDTELLWQRGLCINFEEMECMAFVSPDNDNKSLQIDFYSTGKYPHGPQFFYIRKHLMDISRKMNLDMYTENIVLERDGRIGRADLSLVLAEQEDNGTEYRVSFANKENPADKKSIKVKIDEILGTVFDQQAIDEIKRVEEDHYIQLKATDRIRLMMCSEERLLKNVISAVANLQNNAYYNRDCIENILNDYIRDELDMIYFVKDQPRHGKSSSGQDAGEVDIMIYREKNRELAIIEALRLGSLNPDAPTKTADGKTKSGKEYLDEHVIKAIDKYDTHGVPYTYVLIYFTGSEFGDFWKKADQYFRAFEFPYSRIGSVQNIDTGYADLRCLSQKLDRNGTTVTTYLMAVKLRKPLTKSRKAAVPNN